MASSVRFPLVLLLVCVGCAAPDEDDGLGGAGDGTEMTADGPIPEEGGQPLLDWLEGRGYAMWEAESGLHDSSGPHFGNVRTYVNDVLLESLEAGNETHPVGSASVKELYGDEMGSVAGWSSMVKLEEDSAGGDGWYWFERFGDSNFADAAGAGACTGCHASGIDFFRTPFPLQ